MNLYISVIDEVVENNEKPLRENFKEITLCLVKKTKTTFTCKNMTKRLPILKWLPNYNSKDCIGDLLAGITIGLTVIPQSMAYAALAGLPLEVIFESDNIISFCLNCYRRIYSFLARSLRFVSRKSNLRIHRILQRSGNGTNGYSIVDDV